MLLGLLRGRELDMYPLVSVRSAQGNELERLNSGSISLLVPFPPTLPLLISRSHSSSYPICLGLLPFLSVFINVLLYLFCTCLINLHRRICTVGYPMNMMCCCKDYTQISPMRRITSLGDRRAKVDFFFRNDSYALFIIKKEN